MEMDERKIRILQAIINDYIETAEPVGSRTIAKKYDLGISSATIRNEMADLEEMGYIEQLHSSSGRKPSDRGYRLYVDKLMHIPQLSPEEELIIKSQLVDAALYEADKIVKQAITLLSELTQLTCIVKTPSIKKSRLKSITLINIDKFDVLSIVVTDSGLIRNNVIRVNKMIEETALLKLNNILNSRLRNLTIEDINLEVITNLKSELYNYDGVFDAIIPVLYDSLKSSDSSEYYTQGSNNIFNYPEYKDIDKAREFLSLMSDSKNLKNLLISNSNLNISIGTENTVESAKDCSIVTAVYKLNDRNLGSIGVVGPTRIPYSKVVSMVTSIVRTINDNINKNYTDNG
ncbi:MAG: heat-inducible transcriptional repressor HrcA [Bacillota bacterium]|nr:heat-inducible transcriptional repressor HrcA [Bacillota bacterium]